MKQSRDPQRHTSLLFTYSFSIECIVSATMADIPQLIITGCVYSLGIGIAHTCRRSVETLINVGTDVNDLGDRSVRHSLGLPEVTDLYTCPGNLAFALSVGSSSVIKSLLRAGAIITYNILVGMVYRFTPSKVAFILEEINKDRNYYTNGKLLNAVLKKDTQKMSRLLDAGAIISIDVIELIVSCREDALTNLLLKSIN